MNCTEIRPLLSAYIDGEAAPEERGKVERHLAGCEDCRQAMAEYRAIGGSVRAMPMPVPPANLRRDVWRAIEAREAGGRWRPTSPRTTAATLPGRRTAPTVASVFTNLGNGWAKALPAALLVGALVLAFAVVMLRGPVATAAAQLVEQGEIFDYNQAVHVKFNKDVNYDEARQYTSVRRIEGTTPYTVTVLSEVRRTGTTTGELSLKPVPSWQAGATYEIFIDCPRISLVVGGAAMQKEPIRLSFTAAAHTPTPTSTPTETATPTNTPVPPTNTPEPTAVADNSKPSPSVPVARVTAPASSTKTRPNATATKSSAATPPTGTRVPSTSTPAPVPTNTVEPARTALPTNTPMPTATQTGKPVHTPSPQPPTSTVTATSTPARRVTPSTTSTSRVTPTSTPTGTGHCSITPVRGFGKVWQQNTEVHERVGCPAALEGAVTPTAYQRFEGGYMFWRGDTRTIYVFIGATNDEYGVWREFPDTWQEGDPMPVPTRTPPTKLYAPVRGFGKIWYMNESVQLALGWAIEPESNTGAVWQTFEHGNALWTSDRLIRFLYNDGIYARFEDTYVAPPAGE